MTTPYVPPVRGGTLQFSTTFYDIDDAVTIPAGAVINIVFPDANGEEQTEQVTMTPPSGDDTVFTAIWDTRDVGPGVVFWSIHTTTGSGDPPFAVEDGRFSVNANVANLPSF